MNTKTDTIVAPATPPGRGGVAIIRISGPLTKKIATEILGGLPKPRYATYKKFLNNENAIIDEGLAFYFPAPNSFTGEDVLELHGHGGPVVVDLLIREMVSLGARLARPGEFSERAFLNDKIDLTQAEAIADLIDASSEQAARNAMNSLQGEFSKRIHRLVEHIIQLRMFVEAAIDFVEEEIDFLADNQIQLTLKSAVDDLDEIVKAATQGSLFREGIHVVIAGEPNVGKSSLLNQLSEKDIAIVTDIAGTTRDVLRHEILLDGIPLHIIDTAGLRESEDVVEQEGMRRARQEIENADILLILQDASCKKSSHNFLGSAFEKKSKIIIRNKIDLTQEEPTIQHLSSSVGWAKRSVPTTTETTIISLSAKTGKGIDLLKEHIKSKAGFTSNIEGKFSARRRHLDALSRAKIFLQNAEKELQNKSGELVAEELRLAQQALSEITGEFTTDDLLGRIFSSFCIGK